MATTMHEPESSVWSEPPRVRLEPVVFRQTLLDGSWWPRTGDLEVELRDLVPILDRVRGRVTRLLLSVVGWTPRPHHIRASGRTVSVGYLAGQSPSMMTVLCADGGTFTLRVTAPGPAPGVPDMPEAKPEYRVGEAAGGRLVLSQERVVR
ncbi:MAG TPA: DUF5994 family protein [Actinoplanes sp.]|nr:DUF5994 family protein [Actinoplanes sp.]